MPTNQRVKIKYYNEKGIFIDPKHVAQLLVDGELVGMVITLPLLNLDEMEEFCQAMGMDEDFDDSSPN